jgi:hypothetical protein
VPSTFAKPTLKPASTRLCLLALLGVLAVLMLIPGSAQSAPVATAWRGVQVHSLWATETDQQMDEDLYYAKASGANVVRLDVAWATFESDGPGQYTAWYADRLATFMQDAQQLNLKVIAILFTTPCWASSAPASLKQNCQGDWWDAGVGWYPPTNDQDFANFVQTITSTYASDLAAVEIWNEPDQSSDWVSSNPAGDYAQLLKAAYPAAKAGDPSVPVLAGALAGSDTQFLTSLYQDGIQGYYDGISIHPYNQAQPPAAAPAGTAVRWEFTAGIQAIHALQLQNGDHTPLWITEFGWDTVDNTQQQQASYITQGYQILAGLPYVKAGIVYELHDDIGGSPSDPNANFGLMTQDYTPKPAYAAFTSVMTAPAAPVLTAPATGASVKDNHPVLSFTADPDSTVTAYIDGVLAATATADAGGLATLTVQHLLADGQHSLYATDTDPYGNVSPASGSTTFTAVPTAPAILNPGQGARTGPWLTVKVAGDPGDTATVCIDGQACSNASVDSGGLAVLPPATLSPGRHTMTVLERNAEGRQSPSGPAVTWTVSPERLRVRASAVRKRVMDVRCAVSTGTIQRCSVTAYVRGRRVGAGKVEYRSSGHSRVVVAVRLNSLGRRLTRRPSRRLLVKFIASARVPGGHTLKAVLRVSRG